MGLRTWIWVATLCLVASETLGAKNEPVYDGHALFEWLLIFHRCKSGEQLVNGGIFYVTPQDIEEAKQCGRARAAIQTIGTNALPFLLKRIQSENRLDSAALKLPDKIRKDPTLNRILFPSGSQPTAAELAVVAFDALGPIAISAIPQLTAMMNDPKHPNTAERAIEALAHAGPAAAPHLIKGLANPRTPARELVAVSLGRMQNLGTNTTSVEAALTSCLTDSDQEVRSAARTSLSLLRQAQARAATSTNSATR